MTAVATPAVGVLFFESDYEGPPVAPITVFPGPIFSAPLLRVAKMFRTFEVLAGGSESVTGRNWSVKVTGITIKAGGNGARYTVQTSDLETGSELMLSFTVFPDGLPDKSSAVCWVR